MVTLSEIQYSSSLGNSISSKLSVNKSILDGHIEGFFVYKQNLNGKVDVYCSKIYVDQQLISYIAIFHGIHDEFNCYQNLKKIGAVTTLLLYLTVHNKLCLEHDSRLTWDGMNWLIKIIQANGRGMKITDQNGNKIYLVGLQKEWFDTKDYLSSGITKIIIESNIHKASWLFNKIENRFV